MDDSPELPLGDVSALAQLASLLPPELVNVRINGIACPHVRALAVGFLRDALANGHLVDRSNANGPLREWDGWIVIQAEDRVIHLQTLWKVGQG